ncbi:hypothetical protein BJ166DRAFT_103382 [Pestalotiopsis sp. NC0098]|nr:hypothetical protein BJ166DRAFT_103382 [Pestalotiopsis sp. NC0098]
MGRNTSSTTAYPYLPPHDHRGPRADHALHHSDAGDAAHVKRRRRTRDQGFTEIGNSNRPLEKEPSIKLVESWLARTGTPHMDAAALPTDVAKPHRLLHQRRQPSQELEHRTKSGRSYQPKAVWQPQDLCETSQDSVPLASTKRRLGYRHRKRSSSDDSSLLTVVDPRAASGDTCSSKQLSKPRAGAGRSGSNRNHNASDEEISSWREPTPEPSTFEKRPRRKTREDRYDVKKEKRRAGKTKDDAVPRHKSTQKKNTKKQMVSSSKNVMKNYNSNAVLQDRITVSQPLVPGLFKNKRGITVQPVTDLAYTDMNFLREEKQNITPRPISKRRLSELERQDREIEELSSFFLPAEKTSLNQRPEMIRQTLGTPVAAHDRVSSERSFDGDEVRNRPESLCEEDYRSLSVHSYADRGVRSVTSTRSEQRPGSAATYLTWSSSSIRSPKQHKARCHSVSPVLERQESTGPDDVDELMLATGIFRNTDIYNSDHVPGHSQNGQQLNVPMTRPDQERTRLESIQIKGPEAKNKHLDSHGDSNIVPASLKARLDAIFPPAWREPDVDANSRPREDTDEHNEGARLLSHTQPQNSAAVTEATGARSHDTQSISVRLEESRFPALIDASVGQINSGQLHAHDDSLTRTESRASQSDERLSTTSRDLMPPPPRPSGCSSRRTTPMQMNQTESNSLPRDSPLARANPPSPCHGMTRFFTKDPPAAVDRVAHRLPHVCADLPSESAYNLHELNEPNDKEGKQTPDAASSWLSQAYASMTSDSIHMRNESGTKVPHI